jgi:hypothetical protein
MQKGVDERKKHQHITIGLILGIFFAACQPSTGNSTTKHIKLGHADDFSVWSLSEKPARVGTLFGVEEIKNAGGEMEGQM